MPNNPPLASVRAREVPTQIAPVDQTVVGIGNDRANCFQACLAMISGLPLEECIDITDPAVEDMWVDAVIEWAAQHGWAFKTGIRPPKDRPCIANGPTADRLGVHGVVCEGGNLFHDPHPSRAGIVSVNWWGWLEPIDTATPQLLDEIEGRVKGLRHPVEEAPNPLIGVGRMVRNTALDDVLAAIQEVRHGRS